MARIPNHKIDEMISELKPFENYNATISASITEHGTYIIWHWNTQVLEYEIENKRITRLESDYISQTTSTLIGRIVRSLPRSAVISRIAQTPSKYDQRRLTRMLRL